MSDNGGGAKCVNCARAIRRPEAGSYPESVRWVHDQSPIGVGNRYCDFTGMIAQPCLAGARS